jgi:cysteine desulfurase
MIYLDNAANAPVFPEVLDAMLPWLRPDHVGNPGSIHTQGKKAREAINKAREQVAHMIGADPTEIYFTSGGTESNNAWLKGFKGRYLFTTEVEHDSVLEPLYQNDGACPVNHLELNKDGSVNLEEFEQLLLEFDNTGDAASIMWVNNELGTVNPMKKIGALCKKYNMLFHADAVQAAGHVPMNVKDCGIDFCSLSGHKFGAPLGVGVLYISRSVDKRPWILGGGQENGLRGGTENVPGIVGIGKAAEIVTSRLSDWMFRWSVLRYNFLTTLDIKMPNGFYVNGSENSTSNIISLTIPGVNSESLLLLLDQQDIYLSAGSACSAASSKSSHVLKGIGLSDEDAACTVRISMGYETTVEEMVKVADAIVDVSARLKSIF